MKSLARIFYASKNLSLLNYVPYVPSCPTCLGLYVFSCPMYLVPYVLAVLHASCLRARLPCVPRVLSACVFYMLCALRSRVLYVLACPTCLRALRARLPHVPPALRTLVSHVLRCLHTSCLLCLIYMIKTIMSKCFPNMFLS